jgi:AcrR family transcriptional regulator
MITSEAGVNLGAVNYHFNSKDALILEVLKRRIKPLNDVRLALLDRFESEAGGKPLRVDRILEALFRPALDLLTRSQKGGRYFLKLQAQILAEQGAYLIPLINEEFAEKKRRFHEALHRALPDLTAEDIHWRLHFAVGAFVHVTAHSRVLELASSGNCIATNKEETLKRLVAFCAAGFMAKNEAISGSLD